MCFLNRVHYKYYINIIKIRQYIYFNIAGVLGFWGSPPKKKPEVGQRKAMECTGRGPPPAQEMIDADTNEYGPAHMYTDKTQADIASTRSMPRSEFAYPGEAPQPEVYQRAPPQWETGVWTPQKTSRGLGRTI